MSSGTVARYILKVRWKDRIVKGWGSVSQLHCWLSVCQTSMVVIVTEFQL
ncbi:hypothetical protein K3495_g6110 [Podosphaera aphanis]|nr:hypothetical protein K3495_g6110 [Podosphaera aphanis]